MHCVVSTSSVGLSTSVVSVSTVTSRVSHTASSRQQQTSVKAQDLRCREEKVRKKEEELKQKQYIIDNAEKKRKDLETYVEKTEARNLELEQTVRILRRRLVAYEEKGHVNDQEQMKNGQRQRKEQCVISCDENVTLLQKVHDKVTNFVMKRIDSEIDGLLTQDNVRQKRNSDQHFNHAHTSSSSAGTAQGPPTICLATNNKQITHTYSVNSRSQPYAAPNMDEGIPLDLRMHHVMNDNLRVNPTPAPVQQYITSNILTPANVTKMRPTVVNDRNRSNIRNSIYTECNPR